jgi:hypothetical protein
LYVGLAACIWALCVPSSGFRPSGYRNACILPERVFMPGIGKLLNEAAQFNSHEMEKRLGKQLEGFIGFVESLRGKRLRV